ncbi:MAG: CDP-alcohol phosphatidyltransferase family protein [Vigna little leaf phytoplasma]|nr:CDP-alcohol phosphatidyltransferase family protein [Vigna little leaf phytoplasma]
MMIRDLFKISANLMTILRIILVFLLLPLLYSAHQNDYAIIWGLDKSRQTFSVIFVCSALTDYLDGYIARKFKQQTLFGKCFDPIADKLLVIISFLYLHILSKDGCLLSTENGNKKISFYVMLILIVIILRDFLIMGMRILMAFEKNEKIVASFWGKSKTFLNFISIIFLLFAKNIEQIIGSNAIIHIITICLMVNIILVILSAIAYIRTNYHVISKNFFIKVKNKK